MDVWFTSGTFNDIILMKLCFFLFIGLGILGIFKKWKPIYFLILLGVTSALAYYFLVRQTSLMFWGHTGDEIFVAANYEMAAHGSIFSDFAYVALPPFYPPLFFWLFSIPGRILNLNGLQLVKLANLLVFCFLPLLFYYLQKVFWQKKTKEDVLPGRTSWFISSLILFALLTADTVFLKQYELVSAALSVLWAVFLFFVIFKGRPTFWQLLIFGIIGALLFVSFYFWFILIALAIVFFNLFSLEKINIKIYTRYFLVALLVIILSAFYWYPLALSYKHFGVENWQLGFTYIKRITDIGFPALFSLSGFMTLIGLVSLIFYRKNFYVRTLLFLFLAPYIWQLIGFFNILFFSTPLQESKGLIFFNTTILALAFGFFVEQLWLKYQVKIKAFALVEVLPIVGLLLLSTLFIFGDFANDPFVYGVKNRAVIQTGSEDLINFLKNKDTFGQINLDAGIGGIYAYLPINNFLFHNIHASHPAANFSSRLSYLEDLSLSKNSEEFYQQVNNNQWGKISRFILFQSTGNTYDLYFHLDDFPNGIKEQVVKIPKSLFDNKYFNLAYQSKDFVIFETR